MSIVPHITTERLLLREARRTDFEAFASIVMDPEIVTPPGPLDRRSAWRLFEAEQGAWIIDGIGIWSVEERATGAFVGGVGAFHREPPPSPNDPDDLELAWGLARAYRGRGLATEAARAVIAFVLETRKPKRIIANIDHDNASSMRVAEKLGMRYEGEVAFYEERLRRYVLASPLSTAS
jgi:RimJ/RimL family protein N-acetyltransferase